MNGLLRILHLEDEPDYCDLVASLLGQAGYQVECVLAQDRTGFESALAPQKFDIILADYLLPSYNGLEALRVAREKCPDTPFLLVSGTIGEQAAIESLKAGATDYVLKLWPERLVPAIRRAVEEARERAERRRIESELALREKYFRALTENALDILTILSRDGLFIYNSPSVTRVLGYEPRELVGQSAFAYVHTDDLPKARRGFQRSLDEPQQVVRLEFRFRRKDDTWCTLEAVGQNRLEEPEIVAMVINSRDVSDRKQAEDRLRESEQRFRDLFESSPDAIFVEDLEGKVLDINPAACRLHGMEREDLMGRSVLDLVPPERRDEVRRDFKKLVEGQLQQIEGLSRTQDGRAVAVEIRASQINYAGREALLLHVRDVTAHKRLEEQLRQSQKMEAIGQLAGGVAHDFNNILTVIHGHASLLTARGDLTGGAAKSAEQISQAAQRAASLTRQLLAFSRRQVMQPRRLDMNEVVGNMTKMLGRLLGEDIALQLNYFPQPVTVQADAGMLEQVLLNLAVNARDAMPKGGVLGIRIAPLEVDAPRVAQQPEAQVGRFVCVTVSDTGCGIPPENLRRIFEPFFTTKEVGKGTGLGLATVYGIVKQHQGWLEVESEFGKGARFRFFLPCSAATAEATEVQPAEPAVRGGTETILVVEDEAPLRELVCNVLSGHGYRILQAESGRRALEVWRESKDHIDLLLTDLVMPDRMNGRELAATLRAEYPRLKVLFTSGYSAHEVGQDSVLPCDLNYLQKPYQPRKLAQAVRDCLDAVN